MTKPMPIRNYAGNQVEITKETRAIEVVVAIEPQVSPAFG